MSDLLKIIKAGTKNKTTVNFPRSNKKIDVHLLPNEDTLQSTADTEKLFKQLGITVEFHNVNSWTNEQSLQMLYRAIKDPENGQPVAPDISTFRALTTNEDRRDLMDVYNALVEECDPSPFTMDPQEFDAFIENVKKKSRSDYWELFKFGNAEKACAIFGKCAEELTDGQWTYILIMRLLEEESLPGNGKKKLEAAYDLVAIEVDD